MASFMKGLYQGPRALSQEYRAGGRASGTGGKSIWDEDQEYKNALIEFKRLGLSGQELELAKYDFHQRKLFERRKRGFEIESQINDLYAQAGMTRPQLGRIKSFKKKD